MHLSSFAFAFAFALSSILAAPIPSIFDGILDDDPDNKDAVTTLSTSQVQAFAPQALLAQAAYCDNATAALPTVEMLLTGGDGGVTPRFFVGHDPASQSIVVAHEGTESDNILSIINDAEFAKVPLDQAFFPGASSDIETHQGFSLTFARTATDILGAVTKGLADKNVNSVIVSGHSLGAALAIMTSVYLNQQLNNATVNPAATNPGKTTISTVVFGSPRGGNQAYADFVDQNLPGLVHMHNQNDLVPTVPPHELDYQHPSGELFVQPADPHTVVSCPGQENENCSAGNDLVDVSIADHAGPYAGALMGRSQCPVLV